MSTPNGNTEGLPNSATTTANSDCEQIEQRLAKLRSETTRLVAQKELEERLARLANRDPQYYSSTEPPIKIYQMIQASQRLTDTEKTDNLMQQLMGEISLGDSLTNSTKSIDDEIEKRLQLLREESASHSSKITTHSSKFKSKNHRQLIEEILSSPDVRMSDQQDDDQQSSEDDDETLEWCTTCNEDAALRCHDCDEDIYCLECYRKLHNNDPDMKGHRTSAFSKIAKQKSSQKLPS